MRHDGYGFSFVNYKMCDRHTGARIDAGNGCSVKTYYPTNTIFLHPPVHFKTESA